MCGHCLGDWLSVVVIEGKSVVTMTRLVFRYRGNPIVMNARLSVLPNPFLSERVNSPQTWGCTIHCISPSPVRARPYGGAVANRLIELN